MFFYKLSILIAYLLYVISFSVFLEKLYNKNFIWLFERRIAILKICLSLIGSLTVDYKLIGLTFLIDFLLFYEIVLLNVLLRIYAGLILSFLSGNLIPLIFLCNILSFVDSFRLIIGNLDPEDISKGSSAALKFYKELPPSGKTGFLLGGAVTLGAVSYIGYHNLTAFNAGYQTWVLNQAELQSQYVHYQHGAENVDLLKKYQLEDIKNRANCLILKQKFFFYSAYHLGLYFELVVEEFPPNITGLNFKPIGDK